MHEGGERSRAIRALFALPLALAAGAAAAAPGADDGRAYAAVWLVEPGLAPKGPQIIPKEKFVYWHRLLPPSLVALETAAVDAATGKTLAPAGSELFGLMTKGPPLYCLAGREYKQRCFADMDGDGRLDGHFTRSNPIVVLPSFTGKRPQKLGGLRGGAYQRRDPRTMTQRYVVGVKFDRIQDWFQKPAPVFKIVYGTEEWREELSADVFPAKGSDGTLVRVLGAQFRILELSGETLKVEIDTTLPPQPFAVQRTTTYQMY